jgi:hypothetical protein
VGGNYAQLMQKFTQKIFKSPSSDQSQLLPVQTQGLGVLWLGMGHVSIGTELGIAHSNPCKSRRRPWVVVIRLKIGSFHLCCCSRGTSCLSTAPLLGLGRLLLLACFDEAHLGTEAGK